MKNIYTKLIIWIKTHQVAAVFAGVFLIIVLFFGYKTVFGGSSATSYVVGTVTKGDLVLTVNGTGQVEAENQVDLKPQGTTQSASTITAVDVKQGDKVVTNQLIAVIGNASALTQLKQAQANVESAQASYDKVVSGATVQSIAVSQSAVSSSQTSLTNAKQSLLSKISSSYNDASSVVTTDTNALFSNPNTINPKYGVSNSNSTNSQLVINIVNEREQINALLPQWNSSIGTADATGDLTTLSSVSTNNLNTILQYLNDILSDLTTYETNSSSAATYTGSINSGRSTIMSDISAVQSALQQVTTAQSSLAQSNASLAQTTAPARSEDIASAQASLDNSKAALQAAQNTYDQSFIRAPFSGVVAAVNVSVGAVVDTNTVVASIITKQQIAKISLNEVDAAQVKIGQTAKVTFNALPGVTATGTVAQIDTIGTVTQGVVSYNAKIAFDASDQGVKPGMSVSVTIAVGKDVGVLLVPNSAVTSVGSNSNVLVLDGVSGAADGATISLTTAPKSVSVQIGDSDNKNTVITSGLTEGELIVTHTVTGATKAASGGLLSGPGA
ncbi:MAG: efflux RND transporter periplasmic adaptor subunit [Patescibacteria group bacterium]|nr:efflux RND transporter periplasmic adaptor subunit [Patescibacteria group bacterium]